MSDCNAQNLLTSAIKSGFRDLVPEADTMAVMNQLLCDINNGGGGDVVTKEGVVTNSNPTFIPIFAASVASSSYRKRYVVTSDCSELHLHYAGLATSGGAIVPVSWSGKCSIQRADGSGNPTGASIAVTFGGSSTFTLNGDIQRSDTIAASFVSGEILYVITYNITNAFPSNCYLTPLSGDNIAFGVDAVADPSLFTNDGSQIGISALAPSLITGKIQQDNQKRCVIGYGDSIMQDFTDSDTTIQRGWLGRALGGDFGYVNVGVGGSTAQSVAGNPTGYAAIYYPAKYCGLAVYDFGYNDFFASLSSAVSMEGWTNTIVAAIKAEGVENVIGCTVLPGSTSTDGWTTAVNQTPRAEGGRTTYNAWVLANSATPFDGVYDFNGSLALASNLQKRDPGPATVVATDTAGAASNINAIRTSANGVGSASWAGATIKWTHLGVDYYGQVFAYRPSLVGGLNIVFTSGLQGTELISPGDTYVIINSWDGDVSGGGAHPNGYGHAHAASVAAGTLVPLIESLVPPVPPPPVTTYLPLAGGTMTGPIVFAGSQTTATTSTPNIVQLTDSIVSTSTTTAATPNSVKNAVAAAVAASGTVTSVSVTTANGVSGTVATATTTPAISLALGAITPTTVTPSGQFVGTATGVAYTFAGDTTTGMGRGGAGVITFTFSGTVKQFTDGSTGQFFVNEASGLSSGAQIEATMDSSVSNALFVMGYGKALNFYGCGVGGTKASPTATTTSQVGRFGLRGQDNLTAGTTTTALGADIEFTPTGTWSSTDHGTTATITTTPSGSTTRSAAITVDGSQNTTIANTTKGSFQAAGTATTCTGATTGTGSKANAGFVTATTTGTSTIVITFPFTATTGWAIAPQNNTTANLIRQTASTTTTATIVGVTVSGDVISYVATAY